MKKIFYSFILVIMLFLCFPLKVSAIDFDLGNLGKGYDSTIVTENDNLIDADMKTTVKKIANTIIRIFQILAVAGIMYTGIKYMMADGDSKGKLKKHLINIAIGCVIVFATSTLVSFVVNIGNSVIK